VAGKKSFMWWEKTVEYAFVQRFMPPSATTGHFLAPLDGDHEKAGDAILGLKEKLVLIEFKRTRGDLKSETKKFFDYKSAKKDLKKNDGHHLLVYGVAKKKKTLDLVAQTYFKGVDVGLEKFAERAVAFDEFKKYLKLFLYHKNRNGEGGTPLELEDLPPDPGGLGYCVVAGVVSSQPCFVMSLEDFLSSFKKPDEGASGFHTQPLTPFSPSTIKVEREKQLAGLLTHE